MIFQRPSLLGSYIISYIIAYNRIKINLHIKDLFVYLRIKPYHIMQKIYTFSLELSMKLLNNVTEIHGFNGQWDVIEKREGHSLKQLKSIATVNSIGASTRIEGSRLTDDEVRVLIDKLKISKLEERDEQEVAGYFEALDTISESYKDIEINEGNIKNLHNILMKYCEKDHWHKGNYKQVSNSVEANLPDGTKQIIFRTAEPGIPTENAMKNLIEWYKLDNETHPIIKSSAFVYDFLSIHPFQDGNGRLSRLIGTLLLLRHGYSWIQYVSFEHEIESRKSEYYQILMSTQKQRPGENISQWIFFFIDCMKNIQNKLLNKLENKEKSNINLSPRDKSILNFIENHPGSKSGEISKKLDIPLPTVKKLLAQMVNEKLIQKFGLGAGTNYSTEISGILNTNLMFNLTNNNRLKDFLLVKSQSFIEIKKIILTPLFNWQKPDDWSIKLMNNGLYFKVSCEKPDKSSYSQTYTISEYNSEYFFQPIFNLNAPINIPLSIKGKKTNFNEFPMKITIELFGSVSKFDFDVMFVYDEF